MLMTAKAGGHFASGWSDARASWTRWSATRTWWCLRPRLPSESGRRWPWKSMIGRAMRLAGVLHNASCTVLRSAPGPVAAAFVQCHPAPRASLDFVPIGKDLGNDGIRILTQGEGSPEARNRLHGRARLSERSEVPASTARVRSVAARSGDRRVESQGARRRAVESFLPASDTAPG